MRAILLGTAAGGGFPQWNCACQMCARAGKPGVPARTQDCVAISANDVDWYLLNASPDIRTQLMSSVRLTPGPGVRQTPLRAVLLTDAELDHVTGLLALREGTLQVYATRTVLTALRDHLPLQSVLAGYQGWEWHEIRPGLPFTLEGRPAGAESAILRVTATVVGDKRPKYVQTSDEESSADGESWVVAYRIEDPATGGVLVYAPCLPHWSPAMDVLVEDASCVLLDGTFHGPSEMAGATGNRVGGTAQRTMGHLPISGPNGSLSALRRHPGVRRVYTHLNNTNPVLDAGSPQRAELVAAGAEVLDDGTELVL